MDELHNMKVAVLATDGVEEVELTEPVKALKDAGVVAKMIPKPAHVTSTANLCLSVDASAKDGAVAALGKANVALGGIA